MAHISIWVSLDNDAQAADGKRTPGEVLRAIESALHRNADQRAMPFERGEHGDIFDSHGERIGDWRVTK